MTTDYLALPGMQRRWKQQVKYIWISNAFVICKLPGMITNALEAFQLLGSGDFYTRPDDIPFFLIALESLSNDGFGIALFCIFLVFDVNKVCHHSYQLLSNHLLVQCAEVAMTLLIL